MNNSVLESIIELLKSNKELPNYQAERRIDIFVNLFLERILSKYLNTDVTYCCPEYPLKKEADKRSTKLDYLCYTDNDILFVELKTDKSSIKKEQIDIYFDYKNWEKCKESFDIILDTNRSKEYQKKYTTLNSKLTAITNQENIRIIYLSPLAEKQYEKIGSYKILNRIHFNRLQLSLSNEEKIIWDFLCEIEMQVFEIVI